MFTCRSLVDGGGGGGDEAGRNATTTAMATDEGGGSLGEQRNVGALEFLVFVLGVLQVVVLLLLAGVQHWMRWAHARKRRRAPYAGLSRLQRNWLINPAYVHILVTLAVAEIAVGVANILVAIPPIPPGHRIDTAGVWAGVLGGAMYGGYHAVLEGIALFLMGSGSGLRSLRQAARTAAWLGLAIGVLDGLAYTAWAWSPWYPALVGLLFNLAYEGGLLAFYLGLWLLPDAWLSRRPACVFYARLWSVYKVFSLTWQVALFLRQDFAFCMYIVGTHLFFGLLKPLFVFLTLLRDSKYWQGILNDSVVQRLTKHSSGSAIDVRTPLLGTDLDVTTAQELARSMDTLESASRVIHFAELGLGGGLRPFSDRDVIGAGATARVFRGQYRKQDVAIKMLYCMTLTPETVENFCRESTLLSTLTHPNVVRVHGVCVAPPCVCLVMERCSGSLYELLQLRRPRLMSWDLKLKLAREAAEGLAALHLQRPPILHRDVKSCNFLVGRCTVADWAPPEVLRWLRTIGMPHFAAPFGQAPNGGVSGRSLLGMGKEGLRKICRTSAAQNPSFEILWTHVEALQRLQRESDEDYPVVKISDLELSSRGQYELLASQSTPQQPRWTAPEVLEHGDGLYTTASDCYALGLVIWEILTGEIPFGSLGLYSAELEHRIVVEQLRPQVPPGTPRPLRALLKALWDEDPQRRKSAEITAKLLAGMRDRWLQQVSPESEAESRTATPTQDGADSPSPPPEFAARRPRHARHVRHDSGSLALSDLEALRSWERTGPSPASRPSTPDLPAHLTGVYIDVEPDPDLSENYL